MADAKGGVLPYRTTGEELERFVEARARGRDLAQLQALNFATGGFQGTLAGATALGMLDPDSKELLPAGRDFALADPGERRALLLNAMRDYEPFGLLLDAVFGRGQQAETSLDWILTWWGTHDYGNSQTNRDEGSSAFAKLVEYVGLGSYVAGRRGHPTRIRWNENAATLVRGRPQPGEMPRQASAEPFRASERPRAPEPKPRQAREAQAPPAPPQPYIEPEPRSSPAQRKTELEPQPVAFEGRSSLVLTLGPGRTVDLSVPAQVTAAEKQRLISLINLFISTPGE